MVERTSRLRLIIDSSDARSASTDLDRFSDQADRAGRASGNITQGTSAASAGLGRMAGAAVTAGVALTTAAAALTTFGAIQFAADFERQMSAVLAITGATQAQFARLQDTARELGATTVFSAQEAAEAMEFLARAGFNAEQIISGIPATLDLAAAGALDLGRAADIASNVLSGFALPIENLANVSDVLALAAARSNTTVEQLGEALKFAAPSATAFGLEVEETVAIIGRLGDAGLQGGLAGRGFSSLLTQIENNRDEIEALIGDFDIAEDGVADIIGRLREAGITTQEIISIFRAENVDVFSIIANAANETAAGIDSFAQSLRNADGFSRETARTLTDNLRGAQLALRSAFQDLQITVADQGALQGVTEIVRQLTDLFRSDAAREWAMGVGEGLAAASFIAAGLLETIRGINRESGNAPQRERISFEQRRENAQEFGPVISGLFDIALGVPTALEGLERVGREAAQLREAESRFESLGEAGARQLQSILNNADRLNQEIRQITENGEEVITVFDLIAQRGPQLVVPDSTAPTIQAIADALRNVADEADEAEDGLSRFAGTQLGVQLERSEQLLAAARRGVQAFNDLELEFDIQDQADRILAQLGEGFNRGEVEVAVRAIINNDQAARALIDAAEEAAQAFAERLENLRIEISTDSIDRIEEFERRFQTTFREFGLDPRNPQDRSRLEDILENLEREIGELNRQNFGQQLNDFQQGQLEQRTEEIERIREALEGSRAANDNDGGILRSLSEQTGAIIQGANQAQRGVEQLESAIFDSSASLGERLGLFANSIANTIGGIGSLFAESAEAFAETALGRISESLGAIGALVQLGQAIFGFIFGNRTGVVDTDLESGRRGFVQDAADEDVNRLRDQITNQTLSAVNDIVALIGAEFRDGISLTTFARSNEIGVNLSDTETRAAVSEVIRLDPNDVQGLAIEAVRLVLSQAVEGGSQALLDYANAALEAGRTTDTVAEGLRNLQAVFDLAADDLSPIQEALQNISDVVDPVIEDLTALGQSIENIQSAAQAARRALGEDFISDIQTEILGFRNATLGDFRRILDEQSRLLADAQALLDAGAITPAEFDLVQVRNALQRENFFAGLSQDELDSLGDFFGEIRSSGGEIAVILTQLTTAFAEFTDNVAETRDRLERQARDLQRAADTIFAARDAIQQRFPALSGGALLNDLRSQLQTAQRDFEAGDFTRADDLAAIANQFVDVARDIFGSTQQFATERDFALAVLDQTGTLAQNEVNDLLSEIEALNQQVEVLNNIRDILESPDPSLTLLQQQIDQGTVTNDLISQLLVQYIALTQEARAIALTPGQVQALTEGFFGGQAAQNAGGGAPVVDIAPVVSAVTGAQASNDNLLRSINSNLQTLINETRRTSAQNLLLAG